ncbi:MAG: formyltransferase family protein [Candidatus Saccharimonas sp.]
MKRVVVIANRLNVLQCLEDLGGIEIIKLYVLEGSLLHKQINTIHIGKRVAVDVFTMKEKVRLLDELRRLDFDVLISNGCPFILPVKELKRDGQLFINIHPTLLPDLKGKTPLNGVFMTHRKYIGATMHYIDDGIDTGNIIAQEKVKLTPDIDQGLVYNISFDLEKAVFDKGWKLLQKHKFLFSGTRQKGTGTYFNRTDDNQTANVEVDSTDTILDKIRSFNIRGQGTRLLTRKYSYLVYAAERIVNPYLLNKYKTVTPEDVALKYDNKLMIKTLDGMIKLIDYEEVG